MLEFTRDEHLYRVRKLDTFKQMHLLRRVGPAFIQLRKERPQGEINDPLVGFEILLEALNAMKDEDIDFVIKTCAAAVQRQQGTNGAGVWASILDPRSGLFMFDDIDLPSVFEIVGRVLQENLGGFFPTTNLSAGPPAETAPPLSG